MSKIIMSVFINHQSFRRNLSNSQFNNRHLNHNNQFMYSLSNSDSEVEYRFLQPSRDYEKGLFELLSMLTKAPLPSKQELFQHMEQMSRLHTKHINVVGEINGKLVAFGTILISNTLKGKVGKIQNIVTDKDQRGKGIGRKIIEILKEQGDKQGCTLISLFCQEKNVQFYRKLGFEIKGDIYAYYK